MKRLVTLSSKGVPGGKSEGAPTPAQAPLPPLLGPRVSAGP